MDTLVKPEQQRSAARIRESAGAIDRLVNLDLKGKRLIDFLYEEACRVYATPLSTAAAELILQSVGEGAVVAHLTGFPEMPWLGRGTAETDGPVGAAVLARSLFKIRKTVSVFVCESQFAGAIEGALRGIGLLPLRTTEVAIGAVRPGDPVCLIDVHDTAIDADAWCARYRPSLIVAIERPGANAQGAYHNMRGGSLTHCLTNIEDVFVAAVGRGIPTIGIGDGGNELGMGRLRDIVAARLAAGRDCGCGCGGGIATAAEAQALVTAVVSNFGATAIAASLALITRQREALPSVELELRSLDGCIAGGGVEGRNYQTLPTVDGMGARAYEGVLAVIADIVDRHLQEN